MLFYTCTPRVYSYNLLVCTNYTLLHNKFLLCNFNVNTYYILYYRYILLFIIMYLYIIYFYFYIHITNNRRKHIHKNTFIDIDFKSKSCLNFLVIQIYNILIIIKLKEKIYFRKYSVYLKLYCTYNNVL